MIAAGQQRARRGDMLGVDAEMGGEVEKIGFMRENEIEKGRKEGRIRGRVANVFRTQAAFGEEAAEAGIVARDETERLGGDRFGGVDGGAGALFEVHCHFHFGKECHVRYHGNE